MFNAVGKSCLTGFDSYHLLRAFRGVGANFTAAGEALHMTQVPTEGMCRQGGAATTGNASGFSAEALPGHLGHVERLFGHGHGSSRLEISQLRL